MKKPTASLYYVWSVIELLTRVKRPGDMVRLFTRNRLPREGLMRLRRKGLKYKIRSRMDAWSVKEAVIDRFYERHGMRIGQEWKIVDIGAAIGEFTILAASIAKAGSVFAFEPNPESVRIMKENIQHNRLKNVYVNQCGVWSQEQQLMGLKMGTGEPLQAETVAQEEGCPVGFDVVTLNQVVEDVVQADLDLLKLDCEGAEYAIFEGTTDETFARIKRISMEYHDLDNQRQHHWLKSLLQAKGFKVKIVPNAVYKDIGYLYASRTADRE